MIYHLRIRRCFGGSCDVPLEGSIGHKALRWRVSCRGPFTASVFGSICASPCWVWGLVSRNKRDSCCVLQSRLRSLLAGQGGTRRRRHWAILMVMFSPISRQTGDPQTCPGPRKTQRKAKAEQLALRSLSRGFLRDSDPWGGTASSSWMAMDVWAGLARGDEPRF